jgi:opine dehydrogenase
VTAQPVWAIVGAGMGGKGLAAELGLGGNRVRIQDIVEAQIAGIRSRGGLRVEGRPKDFAPVGLASTDLAAGVDGADVILVSTYGEAHEAVATALAPLLRDGQLVLLIQGHVGGALVVRRGLEQAGCRARVDVAEMDGYPYMLAVLSPDAVRMTTIKNIVQVAALPASRTGFVLERIRGAFPYAVAAPTVLHTGLMDLGPVVHVSGMVGNAGRIEGGQDYHFYRDGMTPGVVALAAALDAERMDVVRAYGLGLPNIDDWVEQTYGIREATLYETLQQMSQSHFKYAPAPDTLQHRYLTQDTGCGLVPFVALGTAAGISMPASQSTITVAGLLSGHDFRREGRSLERLGLAGKSAREVIDFVTS